MSRPVRGHGIEQLFERLAATEHEIPFLAELNRRLLRDCDDDELLVQLDQNLELARQLRSEIRAAAGMGDEAPTSHLREMFSVM